MPLIFALLILILATPLRAQTAIPRLLLSEDPVAEPRIVEFGGGRSPDVVSDGNHFLVVSTNSTYHQPDEIFVSVVDANAETLLPITNRFYGIHPTVATSGGTYLLVSSHTGGSTALLVDREGRVDSTSHRLHNATYDDYPLYIASTAPVAWNGNEFVVLTNVSTPLQPPKWIATRVRESGDVIQNDIPIVSDQWIGTSGIAGRNGISLIASSGLGLSSFRTLIGDVVSAPQGVAGDTLGIAAGDDGFLAIIRSASQLRGQHFDPSGHPDGDPFMIAVGELLAPRVTRSGPGYLIAWADNSRVMRAIHVTGRGDHLDGHTLILANDVESFSVASNAREEIFAFTRTDHVDRTYVARLREDAAPRMPYRGYVGQSTSLVTWDGNEPHVIWSSLGSFEKRIGSSDASLIAPDTFVLAVASNQRSKLHLVLDSRGLEALMPNRSPILLNPERIVSVARVVASGDDFVVVWASSISPYQLYAARISADGEILAAPRPIADSWGSELSVAASADSVLIADRGHGLVLRGNEVIATEDLAIPQFARSLSVASDGKNFLVTWLNPAGSQSSGFITGEVVGPDGRVIGAQRILTPTDGAKTQAATFWTGSNYLLLWSRGRDWEPPSDLWAVRVFAGGELLDDSPVHLGTLDGYLSSIAVGPAGMIAVSYSRSVTEPVPMQRTYARIIVPARQRSLAPR